MEELKRSHEEASQKYEERMRQLREQQGKLVVDSNVNITEALKKMGSFF
jgi:hypothetical protein